MNQAKATNLLSILAIIIAVASLALGWTAYNRAGRDLENLMEDKMAEYRQELRIQVARLEARTQLLTLRADIAVSESYQELSREVATIREELELAYEGASFELATEWQEIKATLEALERDLRDDSAEAVQSLQDTLELLEEDIKTENN